MAIDVRRIVIDYLVENNYDGLYYPNECACLLGDLVPCESDFSECKPGYKTKCDCPEGCDFHISKSRPTPAAPDLGDAGANSNPLPDTPKQVS